MITPAGVNSLPNQDPTIKGIAERAIYADAIAAMRGRDYAVSETFFKRQLDLYPGGTLAANAIYWLGELHLNNGKLDKALEQFARVTALYSGSSKVPDAMYKTGVVLQRMGKEQEARAALERCFATYPESPAGALAKMYLEVMDM